MHVGVAIRLKGYIYLGSSIQKASAVVVNTALTYILPAVTGKIYLLVDIYTILSAHQIGSD